MLGVAVGSDGIFIALDFPQSENVWVFQATADVEADHAGFLDRRVA
jgi:hypothetical protein